MFEAQYFRNVAAESGLIFLDPDDGGTASRFHFILDEGAIITPADPPRVLKLVTLAESYGEHLPLLRQRALVSRIRQGGTVPWTRSVCTACDPREWVTLEDWLAKAGHRYRRKQ